MQCVYSLFYIWCKAMNAYDFDKTIYDGDSTIDFYFYCLKRYPNILVCLPRQLMGAINYKIGRIEKTKFKEEFYCFLQKIENIEFEVSCFWDKNEQKIKAWYIDKQKEDDLIISASPYFLLIEICKRLGVSNVIASRVDKNSGKYDGLNCYGEEKARRFREAFGNEIILHEFYSDSESDFPLLSMACSPFIVKKNKIIKWRR